MMDGLAVLEQQQALNGGGGATAHAQMADPEDAGLFDDLDFDLRVSRFVGGMVLGAALALLLLRVAGFRFSFGTQVGAG